MKDSWADGKEAGKQLFQQEPALQPSMDVSPRQDAFSNKREPQPAFSQTPGLLHSFLCCAVLCCASSCASSCANFGCVVPYNTAPPFHVKSHAVLSFSAFHPVLAV